MATSYRQSQFHRRVPALVLVALIALTGFGTGSTGAQAATPHTADGAPFFVLADSGFTSRQTARVRVEGSPATFAPYGGVDIAVYSIPHPFRFLAGQENLHRIRVKGHYTGEGVGNTMRYLWDRWFKQSREIWHQLFTTGSRGAVVQVVPGLSQTPADKIHPHYDHPPQFAPLKKFPLLKHFRYPVDQAKPIGPPQGTHLEGSSSNFLAPPRGNVQVPLGRLKPGLYLVEAYVGSHRAVTCVFVSDTVGVTKVSKGHMLVWTASKTDGKAVGNVRVKWSDGHGVLASATTNAQGLARFKHATPQTSYVIGKDRAGGLFISENFYHDSEVYGHRFYIFTDRPLYKPGNTVHVKVFARDYQGANQSRPLARQSARLRLIDSAGRTLLARKITLDPVDGASIDLPLPDLALPGGYQLKLHEHGHDYTGMFRVARYTKPQFRVDIQFARSHYHPGDTIRGHVKLRYPDGRPVTHAKVDLHIRAQALSMTDNGAHTRFVRQLKEQALTTDGHGIAGFKIPAAARPSRYTLRAVATKYGAFPVSAREQLTLQPGPLPMSVQPVTKPTGTGTLALALGGTSGGTRPAFWTAIRLKDRARAHGSLAADAHRFSIDFNAPGAYSVFVHAKDGSVLARGHVDIPGAHPGTAIGLRLDSDRKHYRIGDVAHVTLDFPHPVDDALLTIERDTVMHASVASHGGDWYQLKRISPTRWQAAIPITGDDAPNVTFSALYVRHGRFEFQNLGLQVHKPPIQVKLSTAHAHYGPGDKVTVDVATTRKGQPVSATVSAAVVDDMVYVLQPELAPSIYDFFFHPLRDSVHTTASLRFYGYDLAWSPKAAITGPHDIQHRSGKLPTLQAQPRRDNIDTAAWKPTLHTNAHGHARFTFTLPDALTRWRITARAMTRDGSAGQAIGYVRAAKPDYLKWTGPTRYRPGDVPAVALLAFSHADKPRKGELEIRIGHGPPRKESVTLAPGSTRLRQQLPIKHDTTVHLRLLADGQVLDALDVPIRVAAHGWPSWHSRTIKDDAPLQLPADARDIQLEPATSVQQRFAGVLDALMDTPFGNAEQTASRLIALSTALAAVPHDDAARALRVRLEQRTQTARERLMRLAGPGARFTWWGHGAGHYPLLTVYAYNADWHASRALGMNLPAKHWRRVFDAYQRGTHMPVLYRALAVHMIQAMNLPVKNLLGGVSKSLADIHPGSFRQRLPAHTSVIYAAPDSDAGHALALLLYLDAAQRAGAPIDKALTQRGQDAAYELADADSPLLRDMATLLTGKVDAGHADTMLADIGPQTPTMGRALIISWLSRDLPWHEKAVAQTPRDLGPHWQPVEHSLATRWRYTGSKPPEALPAKAIKAGPMHLSYRSASTTHAALPVSVERRLYKLVPGKKDGHFRAVPVHGTLHADALYVDQVTLTSHVDKPYRFGVLQVPTVPGTQVITQRYGFRIDNLSILDRNRDEHRPVDVHGHAAPSSMGVLGGENAQVLDGYYADPVALLPAHDSVTVRHLVRFQQPGRFHLPPARYYRLYQPDAKALGPGTGPTWTVQ